MDPFQSVAVFFQALGLENTAGIVAVSGGPDSVALAHLLVSLLQAGKLQRLILAHVNHQLRADESDADEEFIKSLPLLWGMENNPNLTCCCQRIDLAQMVRIQKGNLESLARRERYQWFTQLAHAEGATWVATGHSADDQAETVLFRILRGSGLLGLGGIRQSRTLAERLTLIRPLLTVRRQELLDYLRERDIPYRIDSSNLELRFTRNRLRLELLPLLQKHYNPAIVPLFVRLAEQAQQLHGEAAAQAARLLAESELARAGTIIVFDVKQLALESSYLLREMFRLVWKREGWPMGEMDSQRWKRLVHIVHQKKAVSDFPGNIQVHRVGKVLQIQVKEK